MTNSEVSNLKEARRRPCARKLIKLTARPLLTRCNELRRQSGLRRHPSLHSRGTPFEALQERHDPVQGRRCPYVQSVRDDSARSSSRLVPHSTVRVDRQLQGVRPHFYKGKPDESLRDYLRRFKAEKANIIGCNDQVASSAFKKGLPTEHELYRELAITQSQTLAEVFATAERYAFWDDNCIASKKASKQVDHPTKQASQKSNKFEQKAQDKLR
ncbi:unnamed protein product [Prunus armeniaca]